MVDAIANTAKNVTVVRRDLEADPLPHLGQAAFAALSSAETGHMAASPEHIRDGDVLKEFLAADVVVIGAPMYNFTVPSQLKAWVDRIMVAGKTFRYTETGPKGLVAGKKIVIVSVRGGLFAPETPQASIDFQEPFLRAVFHIIGIDDVEIVRAEGVAIGPKERDAAMNGAFRTIEGLAKQYAPKGAAKAVPELV